MRGFKLTFMPLNLPQVTTYVGINVYSTIKMNCTCHSNRSGGVFNLWFVYGHFYFFELK